MEYETYPFEYSRPRTLAHAIHSDSSDTDGELAVVREEALAAGAVEAVVCDHWARGSAGAANLAAELVKACEAARVNPATNFQFLYPVEALFTVLMLVVLLFLCMYVCL